MDVRGCVHAFGTGVGLVVVFQETAGPAGLVIIHAAFPGDFPGPTPPNEVPLGPGGS